MTDWKDKPHWVLRFGESNKWELTGPDGEVKTQSVRGLGERSLTVNVSHDDLPKFSLGGILYIPESMR